MTHNNVYITIKSYKMSEAPHSENVASLLANISNKSKLGIEYQISKSELALFNGTGVALPLEDKIDFWGELG